MTKLNIGDWVKINCPDKPWFHGEVGEVTWVHLSSDPTWDIADVAMSKTPGHSITRWHVAQLRPISIPCALEILGEDYFA